MRVLVSDDQPDVREALRLLLKGAGHQAVTVDSPGGVLDAAAAQSFDLILMDLNYTRDTTSGREGMDLLASLAERHTAAPVVVMTAWGDIELAVEAMRRGACDFVQKPWDNAHLVETLERQAAQYAERTAARRRERWEMDVAHNVQQRLFPAAAPSAGPLECAAVCCPAGEVGGDYYDFLQPGSGHTAMVLADVSGKGIGAAILMAHLRASFHSQPAELFDNPSALLAGVHQLFWESTPVEQYATLFYADYEAPTGRLRYVNCGHPPPILLRADGRVERLAPNSTVFGLLPGWTATPETVELQPGDALWCFSDGITEACREGGEEFGEARLVELLTARREEPLETAIAAVVRTVAEFGDRAGADDRTVLAARTRPAPDTA
jgi:phosphoserine phosphatase RsbU/P